MGSNRSDGGKEKHVRHREKAAKGRRSSSSSSDSSTSDSSADEKLRKKLIKELKKLKRKEKKKKLRKKEKKHGKRSKEERGKKAKESSSKDLTRDVNEESSSKNAKSYAPMTKDEWEKQQNTFKRVYDGETGRTRLVKGTGEIVEECVSRERQLAINKQATIADGEYFQKVLASKFK